jgi:nucleoside-diphosphate-sugar epimerase
MQARVLITGASGLLGRSVLRQFQAASSANLAWTCYGLCHSREKENMIPCDLTNFQKINDLINNLKVR